MYQTNDASGFGALAFLLIFAVYAYFAYAQHRIAAKLGHPNPWFAWIPIVNTFQLVEMAGKPWHWFLFLLIPGVNIVCFAILWMETAKRVGCSSAWGIMTLVPFINFVAIGVMAFSSGSNSGYYPPSTPPSQKPRQPQQVG
jgi:hypothetical protein